MSGFREFGEFGRETRTTPAIVPDERAAVEDSDTRAQAETVKDATVKTTVMQRDQRQAAIRTSHRHSSYAAIVPNRQGAWGIDERSQKGPRGRHAGAVVKPRERRCMTVELSQHSVSDIVNFGGPTTIYSPRTRISILVNPPE